MTVNQEAFKDIYELITAFPELHEQRNWEAHPEDTGLCGTTRCVAGWATWWKARKMGLLSQKRQPTDTEIRRAVAQELSGVQYLDHADIGAAVLGLDEDQAFNLFHDFNNIRVLDRVKSYAETGEDLSPEDIVKFD